MKSKEKKKDALAILGKTLLYIVAVAMAFAFIILAWEKYDWFPSVKNIIRWVFIPMLLGGLTVFLLRHEFDVLKDKWKPFVQFVIFLTGTLVFVNAGIIVQEACAKVIKVDSISPEDFVLLQICQPDTIKGWIDNVLYLFCSLLVGFSVLVITLMHTGVLNTVFRQS